MATIILTAIGTILGGPIGGALGALAGRQIDGAIFGGGTREGPRLKELAITTSSYGTALPRFYGHMRAPGTIIWSTELVEHSETQGGGKGKPKIKTFTYSVSFAVALASRPIKSIGRIWADGNLLRGADGVLKPDGKMRVHTGHHDQASDTRVAAAEGASRCPAFRGIAYVVFEDLDLSDYFNRIPALTFEVIADDGVISLQSIVGEVVAGTDAALPLDGIAGYSCEGPLTETLRLLDPMFPMDCDASGELLTIARERLQTTPILLPEPAISVGDGDFGGKSGYSRKRSAVPPAPPEVLRYYDIDRDYQPGLQRAPGRPGPGQPGTIELPAAISAANARNLADRAARRAVWQRETIAWRTSELDPDVAPGSIVILPGQPGRWRVNEWEWRETGVELTLARTIPAGADAVPAAPVDPGRANAPLDITAPPTTLAAFELPWDGIGSEGAPALFAAASSVSPNWAGAALFADSGDGSLQSLGPSGRARSIIGLAETALAASQPLLFDRTASVIVELLGDDMMLADATTSQIAMGANRALLGKEIIQFARAVPLGSRRWRLEALLRGRGGNEIAVTGHLAGERFVLLDGTPVALDPALVNSAPATTVVAAGRGDAEPVTSAIALQGITLRPLSPVHPRVRTLPGGLIEARWTRRARGSWLWLDGVDAPLKEQSEQYQVTFGPVTAPLTVWVVTEPLLTISAALKAQLVAALPGGELHVCQQGSYGLSQPLFLATLS